MKIKYNIEEDFVQEGQEVQPKAHKKDTREQDIMSLGLILSVAILVFAVSISIVGGILSLFSSK